MSEPAAAQKMSPKDLLIVIVISLGSFMAGLDATIVNIALPTISRFFAITTVEASWVLNAYLIVMVSLLLAASRIGDMKGYRNIYIFGFAIFTIGSAICGLAPDVGILIGSRMLQAVGGAIISALGAVMVTSYLSPSVRGQALGIVAMFLMLGVALGPVIGGFLTSAFSWRFIFYVNLPVGIFAILLGMHILPRLPPVAPRAKMDVPGVILLFVAMGTLIFGLNNVQGATPSLGAISLVVSIVFWLLFIWQERRGAEPLINTALFSSLGYSLQNVNILILNMVMAGVMVIMPFYLEMVKDIPTDNAGTVLLSLPVGMILTAPIAGKISDAIGTKKPIILGFVLCVVAMFFLTTISAQTSVGRICIYLFLLGAGTGVAYSPLNSAVMGLAPLKDRGSTSGLIRVMTNMGSSIGVAVVMLAATLAAGSKIASVADKALPTAALASAFDAAFFLCMVLEIVAVVLMLAVKHKEPTGKESEAGMAI
ncbi:MAG: MFS transporter [Methanoregula sp.]